MKYRFNYILPPFAVCFMFASCVHKVRVKPRVVLNDSDLPTLVSHFKAIDLSKGVSLSELAERVRENNTQLRTASYKLKEAEGRVTQAGRLENPHLGIGVRKTVPGSEGELEVSFSQRFPFTNRLSLEKRVSKDALIMAKEEIIIAEHSLITAAQLIAVEILQLRKQHAHISKQIAGLNDIANFIAQAADRGELSTIDSSQTKLEVETLKIRQKQILGEQNILTVRLKKYIGLPVGNSIRVSGALPDERLPSKKLALWNRPDFRAKAIEVDFAKSNILLEKSKRYEDFELSFTGAAIAEEDAPEGLDGEAEVGVGISIPLPLYNKNEGNILAASSRAERTALEKSSLATEIKLEVAGYREEMLTWLQQNEEIRLSLLPSARKNSEQLEKSYRSGLGDFTSFLRSKSQLLDIEFKLLENDLKFHEARVKYYSALGIPHSTF